MNRQLARATARLSLLWDRHKRPIKRTYQVPAMGVAFLYRRLLTRPLFVAVTGSLGKTQLKNAIAVVMAKVGDVQFDPGTDNRTYDAAKNLLRVRQSHKACIQEIGLAGPNTMARPVRLYRPDISVITVIRSDHSADFVSRHEHVLEKATVIRELSEEGWAILNADEPDLDVLRAETRARICTYGLAENADVRAVNVVARGPDPVRFDLRIAGESRSVVTRLHGMHNVYTALGAAAVGHVAGLPVDDIAEAIGNIEPVAGRMQFVEHADGVRFLLDDFKASVGSLGAVADYLREFDAGSAQKILLLGSINYGGADLTADYLQVIESVSSCCDEILLVGGFTKSLDTARLPAGVRLFETTREAADELHPRLKSGDLVVIKGRNMHEHLRRVEISRRSTVNCWQMNCERKSFCEDCPFLGHHLD
jgi:UDP-N-acetylmuramoyl-tripeptide--D-alanyl-D-alanine ligase